MVFGSLLRDISHHEEHEVHEGKKLNFNDLNRCNDGTDLCASWNASGYSFSAEFSKATLRKT
jgi:hypothetical protein